MQRALLAAHLRACPLGQAGREGVGDFFERAIRLPGSITAWGFADLFREQVCLPPATPGDLGALPTPHNCFVDIPPLLPTSSEISV